jgi:MFS family permease
VSRTASTRNILLALTCCSIATVGISTFLSSLLVRSYDMQVRDAGLLAAFGFLVAVGGVPLLGKSSDQLARHDPRWETWLPAIVCCVGLLASLTLAFSQGLLVLFIVLPIVATATAAQVALAFSLMQGLVAPGMRATSLAIAYALQNLVGGGLGAVLVGLLSDHFARRHGQESLRYAIASISLLLLAGAVFYGMAARSIARENNGHDARLMEHQPTEV